MTPAAPITEDLACIRCQYNLRTRTPADLCPECATPVAESMAHYRDHAQAITNPRQLLAASYLYAAAMFGGVICFAGVYGLKIYSDSLAAPANVLTWMTNFNAMSHLIFIGATVLGTFLAGGAVQKKVLPDAYRPILSLFLVGFSVVNVVTVMLVFSLTRAARFRRAFAVFAILRSIRMGDFVSASMYFALVLIGYFVMRNIARAMASPRLARWTAAAFGLQLVDAALGVGICGWMMTWSPRFSAGVYDGFIFSADLFSTIISVVFGFYWLRVCGVIREQKSFGSVDRGEVGTGPKGTVRSPEEKVTQFLAKQGGRGGGESNG